MKAKHTILVTVIDVKLTLNNFGRWSITVESDQSFADLQSNLITWNSHQISYKKNMFYSKNYTEYLND